LDFVATRTNEAHDDDGVAQLSEPEPKRSCTEERRTTIGKPTFRYVDLGCNEGDLTIEISQQLHERLQSRRGVDFVGLELDKELIRRATQKWTDTKPITGRFQQADITKHLESLVSDDSADLVSLWSTTMWIHIQVGDKGLIQFLNTMATKSSRFIIIEPQPSKCYRRAQTRLRKMGRPEIDASVERLKLRSNVEAEIESIFEAQGFRRVHPKEAGTNTTKWNRNIHLYEKK